MIDLQIERKIKEFAKKKEISIRQLCQKIEMTENGLANSLKNNALKIETLQKIADVFDIPIEWFFVENQTNNEVAFLEKLIQDLRIENINHALNIKQLNEIIEFYKTKYQVGMAIYQILMNEIFKFGIKNNIEIQEFVAESEYFNILHKILIENDENIKSMKNLKNEFLTKFSAD